VKPLHTLSSTYNYANCTKQKRNLELLILFLLILLLFQLNRLLISLNITNGPRHRCRISKHVESFNIFFFFAFTKRSKNEIRSVEYKRWNGITKQENVNTGSVSLALPLLRGRCFLFYCFPRFRAFAFGDARNLRRIGIDIFFLFKINEK